MSRFTDDGSDNRPFYGPPIPTGSTSKLNNYSSYFSALGVPQWEVDQHGEKWWARARFKGEELITYGHPSSSSALETLLSQVSALV